MPLPNLPIPPFPDVPKAPGVPPLARAGRIQSSVVLVATAVAKVLRLFQGPQWGIFSEAGAPLLIGDSVVGMDYRTEAKIADYPIEKGAFSSFNKVQMPFDARACFAVGGSDAERTSFLNTVDKLTKGLDLVSLVTPEVSYDSANVVHYDYRRSQRGGVTLLQVDVWLREVRQTATAAFAQTPTAEPSGASPVSGGTVQTAPPTSAQSSAVPVMVGSQGAG